MKYIRFSIPARDDVIIVFSPKLVHKDVADSMGLRVNSAGFVMGSKDGIPSCGYKSESLNCRAYFEDTVLLRRQMDINIPFTVEEYETVWKEKPSFMP